jgi:hypothetical protein
MWNDHHKAIEQTYTVVTLFCQYLYNRASQSNTDNNFKALITGRFQFSTFYMLLCFLRFVMLCCVTLMCVILHFVIVYFFIFNMFISFLHTIFSPPTRSSPPYMIGIQL